MRSELILRIILTLLVARLTLELDFLLILMVTALT